MKSTTIGAALAGLAMSLLLQSCSQSSNTAQRNSSVSNSGATSSPAPTSTPSLARAPRIVIDSPVSESVGLTVTFRWHVEGVEAGDVYRYKVRLDKGPNACDSGIEEEFDANTETCLSVKLSPSRYNDESLDFAIQAVDSQGRTYCKQGGRIRVSSKLSPSPPCKGGA